MKTNPKTANAKSAIAMISMAKMTGAEYKETVANELTRTELTEMELESILVHFEHDHNIVQVIFEKKLVSEDAALSILEQLRFERTLCEYALETYGTGNEKFICDLVSRAYKFSSMRAKALIRPYQSVITREGAINLYKTTNGNPQICKLFTFTPTCSAPAAACTA